MRGLLEHLPNRGYKVRTHSQEEREQLYEVRTLLEVAACRLVVLRATELPRVLRAPLPKRKHRGP